MTSADRDRRQPASPAWRPPGSCTGRAMPSRCSRRRPDGWPHRHGRRHARRHSAFPVDTGFLVFNDRTYPRADRAVRRARRATRRQRDVVLVPRRRARGLEWAGTDLAALFAQPRQRSCAPRSGGCWPTSCASTARRPRSIDATADVWRVTLGEYLEAGRYGLAFRDWYLLPMAAAIWSSPRSEMLDFPLPTFVRFCHNHGLLQIIDRPQWRTVAGGARTYVEKHRRGTRRRARRHAGRADRPPRAGPRRGRRAADGGASASTQVVLACHSDQALRLLADADARASAAARQRALPVQSRRAAHGSARSAARAPRVVGVELPGGRRPDRRAPGCVTYWINKLQPLPFQTPVHRHAEPAVRAGAAPRAARVRVRASAARRARRSPRSATSRALQGQRRTWFAGAWLGHGFHEDGLASAHRGRRRHRAHAGGAPRPSASPPDGRRDDRPTPRSALRSNPSSAPMRRADRRRGHASRHAAGRECVLRIRRSACALPLSRLARHRRTLRHRAGTGAASSAFTIATTARATAARWTAGSAACWRARAWTRTARSCCMRSRACSGYVFNPVSFWVCHDRDGARARRAVRGQQHVRGAAQLPARASATDGRSLPVRR